MDDMDLDDSHFCIKCKTTIIGLDNYITHRKTACGTHNLKSSPKDVRPKKNNVLTSSPLPSSTAIDLNSHTYESLVFSETSVSSPMRNSYEKKTSDHDKSRKTLNESFDIGTDFGADVLFSYLQIQSIQSIEPLAAHSSAGKVIHSYQSQKSIETAEHAHWIEEDSPLHTIDKNMFKPIEFVDESSASSEDESMTSEHGESIRHISPPTVPANHTGGKWKPENRSRYALRVSPYSPPSSNWAYNLHEEETSDHLEFEQHPPSHHTHGKWVPGSTVAIDYKEMTPNKHTISDLWCNLCSRQLKTKYSFKLHLKSKMHLKHARREEHLARAELEKVELLPNKLADNLDEQTEVERNTKVCRLAKNKRCDLCKHTVRRHLIGKHLISHFHYRRMKAHPDRAMDNMRIILDNMHWIVLQSPFQCRPCRFYANTEDNFLKHWRSKEHVRTCEGPNKFWCSYCHYQCDTNDEMYSHLICRAHQEVLMVINRSVPVCISKKVNITCPKCRKTFRYNFHLRKHLEIFHGDQVTLGTASDAYQNRYRCAICSTYLHSKIALQRHEKYKHNLLNYFCAICELKFETPQMAKKHRQTLEHKAARRAKKQKAKKRLQRKKSRRKSGAPSCRHCSETFASQELLLAHCKKAHPLLVHTCPICSECFAVAQALGRHTRTCRPPDETMAKSVQNKWICKDCTYSCAYESELIYHGIFHRYGNVTRDQKLECPLCKKLFGKQSLLSHLRQHTKEKIFSCDLCDAQFSRRHNLKDHVKNLHAEGSATKKRKRGKDAIKKETYETTNNDDGERTTFSCNECGFITKRMAHLKRHLFTHTGEKPHKCPHCTFRSANWDNLRKHILKTKLHPGRSIYECRYCENEPKSNVFTTNSLHEYQKHLLQVHEIEIDKKN